MFITGYISSDTCCHVYNLNQVSNPSIKVHIENFLLFWSVPYIYLFIFKIQSRLLPYICYIWDLLECSTGCGQSSATMAVSQGKVKNPVVVHSMRLDIGFHAYKTSVTG